MKNLNINPQTQMYPRGFNIDGNFVRFEDLSTYTRYELLTAFPERTTANYFDFINTSWKSERQLLFTLPSMKNLHDNMVLTAARYLENKLNLEESTTPCLKCGDKKVSMATKQVRSADEPTTAFYACAGCGFKWQES